MVTFNGQLKQRKSGGVEFATNIKHIEHIHWKLVFWDFCEGDDTIAEDILRRLLALFGIIPQHMQRFLLDPFDGEHLAAETESHKDAAYECFTALGLTRQTCELATGEAGFAMQ